KMLGMELRYLAWGKVGLLMAYDYIHRFERERGRAPFQIPELRFVEVGIFFEPNTKETRDAYLVEEWIEVPAGKKFVKYINNGSAIPTGFTDTEDQERASFLSFTQHVQYVRSSKLFFVSDYQGAGGLLTDPQILTTP
ncbi:hypothetical protein B0H19DRAFT_930492, partial [Mycena capillaripes]